MHVSRFEPSAHTVGIKVTDFEHLPHLVAPLCQSVNAYIKGQLFEINMFMLCRAPKRYIISANNGNFIKI